MSFVDSGGNFALAETAAGLYNPSARFGRSISRNLSSMNIWNKVFLGFIFAALMAAFVFAAAEINVRYHGSRKTNSLEEKIRETETKIAGILSGTAPEKARIAKDQTEWSFEDVRQMLIEVYTGRGRVYRGCQIKDGSVTGDPAKIQLTVTNPLGIKEDGAAGDEVVTPDTFKGVVYAFTESGPPRFAGRFRVDGTPASMPFHDSAGQEKKGYALNLVSADALTSAEISQLKEDAKLTWTIRLNPPADQNAGSIASLPEDQKANIHADLLELLKLPELTEEQKKKLTPDGIALWERYRKETVMQESAGDYAVRFDGLYTRRNALLRSKAVAESNIAAYKKAIEQAGAEEKKLTHDAELEEKRGEAMTQNKNIVEALLNDYKKERERMHLQIEKMQTDQQVRAAKIQEYQTQAAEIVRQKAAAQTVRTADSPLP
ncbi:MAG: hypothetical protein LBH00_02925 [Planctomycetaceae bacterium]|jgi:hypothetical protein|nr:hypothetical protein [Planctomycetaceae bacterium]